MCSRDAHRDRTNDLAQGLQIGLQVRLDMAWPQRDMSYLKNATPSFTCHSYADCLPAKNRLNLLLALI